MHVVSYGCYINVRVLFCKQLHHQSNTCTVKDLFHIVIFHFREKETGNSKTERVHLVATLDCDDMSLVSYNSIRDCTPSATPKTASTSVQCNLGQLPQYAGNDLKVNMSKSLEFFTSFTGKLGHAFLRVAKRFCVIHDCPKTSSMIYDCSQINRMMHDLIVQCDVWFATVKFR